MTVEFVQDIAQGSMLYALVAGIALLLLVAGVTVAFLASNKHD